MSETDTAKRLGVSQRTLRRWRNNSLSPEYFLTPTGRPRYNPEQVNEFVEKQIKNRHVQDLRNGGMVSRANLKPMPDKNAYQQFVKKHTGGVVQINKYQEAPVDPKLKEINEEARTFLSSDK